VEILDQQVAPVRTWADKLGDFAHSNMIGLAALQLAFLAEAAAQLSPSPGIASAADGTTV
jgi:hypothetical protein